MKHKDIQNLILLIESIHEAKDKDYCLVPNILNGELIVASLEGIRDYFLDTAGEILYNEEKLKEINHGENN